MNMPSYSVNSFTITLAPGGATRNIGLSKRANISGTVVLPSGSVNGDWISIEAGPDSNHDGIYDNADPTKRYYGGSYISVGQSSGSFNVFGVTDGEYLLKAQVPGFIRVSTYTTVSGGVDSTSVLFPPFSTGGAVTGTLTINGDSSNLTPANNGFASVYINLWSPSNFTGSFKQVDIATVGPTTSSTFSINGLENGIYDVYTYIPGFEKNPPGPKSVTVAGGTGAFGLVFNAYTGSLSGVVSLPNADVNFAGHVQLALESQGGSGGPGTGNLTGRVPDDWGRLVLQHWERVSIN